LEVVEELKLLFKGGYWPEDKTKLPKNIQYLFYNPGRYLSNKQEHGGTSFFLEVYLNGVRKLKKQSTKKRQEAKRKAAKRVTKETSRIPKSKIDLIGE
jgi:hypothetical protein